MVINFSIPDEIYQKYVAMNPQNPHKAILKQLDRFQDVRPGDRAIVIAGDDLVSLQRQTQNLVNTPQEVIDLVKNALTVRSEDVNVQLSETQRSRIRQEANFWQKDPGEYASDALKVAVSARFGV